MLLLPCCRPTSAGSNHSFTDSNKVPNPWYSRKSLLLIPRTFLTCQVPELGKGDFHWLELGRQVAWAGTWRQADLWRRLPYWEWLSLFVYSQRDNIMSDIMRCDCRCSCFLSFKWAMQERSYALEERSSADPVMSASMAGGLWAMRRDWFWELGGEPNTNESQTPNTSI